MRAGGERNPKAIRVSRRIFVFVDSMSHAAVDAGCSVAWFSVEDLGVLVRRHRLDDSVTKAPAPTLRSDVIVVDDIGLLPVSEEAAEGLYRLMDGAYERRSVAISSNLHPSKAHTFGRTCARQRRNQHRFEHHPRSASRPASTLSAK